MTESVLCIAYGAKSTQDRHRSIETQLADGRELAGDDGREYRRQDPLIDSRPWSIVGEYKDEAFSAYSGNRGPGLEAAIRHAADLAREQDEPVMLIAQAHDRFARGAGDRPGAARSLVELWHQLRRLNVWLRSYEDDGDLRDSPSVANIGHRAHMDSKRKSRSVKKGLKRRAIDRGKLVGGPRPYGYRWVDGRLEIVSVEAEVVRRIFEDSRHGLSQMALARSLTQAGVPTIHGGDWIQATVRRILTNVLYMGKIRYDGAVYPGEHDSIVTEELWEAARAVREAATRRHGNGGGRYPKGSHLFVRGLLKCGKCRSTMIPRTDSSRKGAGEWYQCDGRRRLGIEFCDQPFVRREVIDEAMFGELMDRFIDLDATRARVRAKRESDAVVANEALAQAEAEALRAGERLQRVQRALQDGHLDPADYAQQRKDLLTEREAAEAAAQRAHDRATALLAEQDPEEETLRRLADLRATVLGDVRSAPNLNAMRRLLAELFESVSYVRSPSGRATLVQSLNWSTINVPAIERAAAEATASGQPVPVTSPVIHQKTLPLETEYDALLT